MRHQLLRSGFLQRRPAGMLPAVLLSAVCVCAAPVVAARADAEGKAAEGKAEFGLSAGEIRLDGKVSAVDAAQKLLVMDAAAFSLPNGKSQTFTAAKPKTIVVSASTKIYVRGDAAQKIELSGVPPGASVIAVGRDDGKRLAARELAVWSAAEGGKFRLDTPSTAAPPTAAPPAVAPVTGTAVQPGGGQGESALNDARFYLLAAINGARRGRGLRLLALDPIANSAAQPHAEEMAVQNYISLWDTEGRQHAQRYTEKGGTGGVGGTYVWTTNFRRSAGRTLDLVSPARFGTAELGIFENYYTGGRDANANILKDIFNPTHTHVGMGLAKAFDGKAETLIHTLQFFDHHLAEVAPIPRKAAVGDEITVSGRLGEGMTLDTIALARSELAAPAAPAQIHGLLNLNWPKDYLALRPQDGQVEVSEDGRFTVRVPLSEDDRPGLYRVTIWVRLQGADGKEVQACASTRTIVVE